MALKIPIGGEAQKDRAVNAFTRVGSVFGACAALHALAFNPYRYEVKEERVPSEAQFSQHLGTLPQIYTSQNAFAIASTAFDAMIDLFKIRSNVSGSRLFNYLLTILPQSRMGIKHLWEAKKPEDFNSTVIDDQEYAEILSLIEVAADFMVFRALKHDKNFMPIVSTKRAVLHTITPSRNIVGGEFPSDAVDHYLADEAEFLAECPGAASWISPLRQILDLTNNHVFSRKELVCHTNQEYALLAEIERPMLTAFMTTALTQLTEYPIIP